MKTTPKIWLYWEGLLPEWVRLCQKTITDHGGGEVVILTDKAFRDLWTEDTDLDLDHLRIAHKADFIRIYMLKHFGGLWLDSDCVVMHSLLPMLETSKVWEFIGYKHWSGALANAFIGGRLGSKTIAAYYDNVVSILRSGKKLEWTEIGEQCIHKAFKDVKVPRLRLAVDTISPYCWSDQGKFFKTGEHTAMFNPNALSYMMCHHAIQKSGKAKQLIEPDTFFSFLIRKSHENCISASS